MLGHHHATISLICMSTHKAMTARCLSNHQAAYGQPAIRALTTAPLRRLALSMLFTIATNSYQTTCTVSERTFNKRQHANARHGVDFPLFTHYDKCHVMIESTALWPSEQLNNKCKLINSEAGVVLRDKFKGGGPHNVYE